MKVRRFVVVIAATTAITVVTAMVGLATNVASAAGHWPAWLEPVRDHPWNALGVLAVLAVVLGVVAALPSPTVPKLVPAAADGGGGERHDVRAVETLPPDSPVFSGRDDELRWLLAAVDDGDGGGAMVIAINGMAGIGKTALAVHAAHRLTDQFPDGQLFIDLRAHTAGQAPVAPADALARLLTDLGVPPQNMPAGPDVATVIEQRAALWRSLLAGRRTLLVLDNAASTEQIRALLPGTGGCLVLVTSRRRLAALPATTIQVDTLEPEHAAELFVRVAGRHRQAEQESDLADLVRLCGYLPLAITLLAGRLRQHPAWNITDLAGRMRQTRDRLRELHAEHLAVAAAFDLSYRDLPAERQQFFRRLGTHPGTDIDAYASAALNAIPVGTAQTYLDDLYNEHLLIEGIAERFSMHDLVREYTRRLAANGGIEEAQGLARLFDYYQHTAARAGQYLRRHTRPETSRIPLSSAGPELANRAEAVAWLSAERANLLACLTYVTDHDQAIRVIGLTDALADFLRLFGPWDQAVTLHLTATGWAQRLGHQLSEAGALTDLGIVQRLTDDYPAATDSLRQALALYRDLGERAGQATALTNLGRVQYLTGDFPAATDSQRQALALYRDLGDRLGEAGALTSLGIARYLTADFPAATDSLRQALALYRDLDNRHGEANVLTDLGRVQYLTGDYRAASDSLRQALALYRDLETRRGQANVLTDLGRVQYLTGDYPAATDSLRQALALQRDLGSRSGQATALSSLGSVQYLTGDYPAATDSLRQALALYGDLGSRSGQVEALNKMGALHLAMTGPEQALDHYRRALRLSREIHSLVDEANSLEGIGRSALRSGDHAAAQANLQQALDLYQSIGAVADAGRVAGELAHFHHAP